MQHLKEITEQAAKAIAELTEELYRHLMMYEWLFW